MRRLLTVFLLGSLGALRADERAKPLGLGDLGPEEFRAKAAADLRCARAWAERLRSVVDRAEARPALFAEAPSAWTLDENRELRGLWQAVLDHAYALEGVKRLYGDAKGLKGAAKDEAFALSHAAGLAQYCEGLRWIALTRGRDRLEKVLDEADPAQGIPAKAFADLKFKLLHLATIARFLSSERKFSKRLPALSASPMGVGEDGPWLLGYPLDASERTHDLLKQRGLQDVLGNGADVVGDLSFEAWFPAQKAVAEWMGDTRVCRLKRNLIRSAQARELCARMVPGDVGVERRNWYLSNVGLPGFWPHAVLYVGTPEEASKAYDADPGVRAWLATLPGAPATLEAAIAAASPEAFRAWKDPAEEGNPRRVLEAVSEGVVLNSVEESLCGDYAAALRPRLKPVDRAKALLEAFRHFGKPYDFNFDFDTDGTLVCSELVYKAYLPGAGKEGLRIPLCEVCGRRTLPPNEIIRLLDEEGDAPERQFDVVGFLDGREKEKDAVFRDASTLRASWKRPKWDIAQE